MYGIFTYIYHKNQPNVGKYTIHGWYGKWNCLSHKGHGFWGRFLVASSDGFKAPWLNSCPRLPPCRRRRGRYLFDFLDRPFKLKICFRYFLVICGHFLGSLLRVICWYHCKKKTGWFTGFTLPETNELHLKMLKMAGWNTKFLLGWPIFGGELFFFRSVLILLAGVHPNFFSCVFRSLVGEGVSIFKELLFLLLLGEMMQVDNLKYFKRLQT